MKRFDMIAASALFALAAFGLQTTSLAQTVPYSASGANAIFEPGNGDYFGFGNGLHLGRHSIDGNVIPVGEFFPEPGVFFRGTFSGTQVVTAADGSTLTMTLNGDVELVFNDQGAAEGMWFPNFEVIDGSGRFEGATGSMSGVAINPPFDPNAAEWPFDWYIDGTLDLNKR